MIFKTRFAPSPTGRIHMGNVRTAMMCWFYARKRGGEFILRVDDTDTQRSDPLLVQAIKDDMEWLELNFDSCFHQSSRFARYNVIAEEMRKTGLLYPCYETKDDLESARKALLKIGRPPIYRKGFGIELPQNKNNEPCWRFAVDADMRLEWNDEIKGPMSIGAHNISDPIVIRQDGSYTYMLPSVIDDYDYEISHVIRGDDHLTNTALQIAMFKTLKAQIPSFAHIPLLQDRDNKLSKRTGSHDIDYMRAQGITVEAMVSYLLSLGSSRHQNMSIDRADHLNEFDISNYNRGACVFLMDMLVKTNRSMLQRMPYSRISNKFPSLVSSEEMWNVARNNISLVSEFAKWSASFSGNNDNVIQDVDREVLEQARETFKTINWAEDKIVECLQKLKSEFGAKKTMITLRRALTGMDHGPELSQIMLVMGKDKVISAIE